MQFGCESCKTQLHIADEKVRGKRLIVRCRRCGAKIAISDPALGKPAPRPAQPSAEAKEPEKPRREPDDESTRAMDSEVLEKALKASKAEESRNGAQRKAAQTASRPESPIWFAMLHGKQTGPITRTELDERTALGEVGPRTYLWKEGMDAWQRARDVPELAALFPAPPATAAPEALAAPAQPARRPPGDERTDIEPLPLGERVHQEEVARELFPSGEQNAVQKNALDLARWASEELVKKPKTAPLKPAPREPPRLMFESAAPPRKSGPAAVFVIFLVLAAAALGLWFLLGRAEAQSGGANASAPAEQAERRSNSEEGRRKLDGNGKALQDCIDRLGRFRKDRRA